MTRLDSPTLVPLLLQLFLFHFADMPPFWLCSALSPHLFNSLLHFFLLSPYNNINMKKILNTLYWVVYIPSSKPCMRAKMNDN